MPLQTTSRPAFGRRITPQAQTVAPARPVSVAEAATAPPPMADEEPTVAWEDLSVDQELEAWKRERGSKFRMPWSQLSLMASLCFGIGSFVLPDSVNDNVEWLLWGLSAVSAIVWFTNRKKKVKDSAAP